MNSPQEEGTNPTSRMEHSIRNARRETEAWARWNEWEKHNTQIACIKARWRSHRAQELKGASDHLIPNPTWFRNLLLENHDQWSANLCLQFSEIFLAGEELQHSDPFPRKDLATQLQGTWLADNLQLLVPSGSASAFQSSLGPREWLSKVVV